MDGEKTLQGLSLKCPPIMTGHAFEGTKSWFLSNLKNFDKKLSFKSKVEAQGNDPAVWTLSNVSDDLLRSWRVPNKVGQCAGVPTSSFNCGKQPRYKHLSTTYWLIPGFGAERPVLTHSWKASVKSMMSSPLSINSSYNVYLIAEKILYLGRKEPKLQDHFTLRLDGWRNGINTPFNTSC